LRVKEQPSRRRSHRFSASDRVEYEHDGRRNVSFLSTLSLTGMVLRSATELPAGATVRFQVHLEGHKGAVAIEGRIVERPEGTRGTPVAFLPNQLQAEQQLRQWVQTHVIPKLEEACARPRPGARALLDLAALHCDVGHYDAAEALYRRGIELHPRTVELYEHYLRAFLHKARLEGADAGPTLMRLEPIAQAALRLSHTPYLQSLASDLAELRHSLDEQSQVEPRGSGSSRRSAPAASPSNSSSPTSAGPQPRIGSGSRSSAAATRASRSTSSGRSRRARRSSR
jgi:hypothetical protein